MQVVAQQQVDQRLLADGVVAQDGGAVQRLERADSGGVGAKRGTCVWGEGGKGVICVRGVGEGGICMSGCGGRGARE